MNELRAISLLVPMNSSHSKSLSDRLICQLTTNGTEIGPRLSSSLDRLILSVDIFWVEELPNMKEKIFLSCLIQMSTQFDLLLHLFSIYTLLVMHSSTAAIFVFGLAQTLQPFLSWFQSQDI